MKPIFLKNTASWEDSSAETASNSPSASLELVGPPDRRHSTGFGGLGSSQVDADGPVDGVWLSPRKVNHSFVARRPRTSGLFGEKLVMLEKCKDAVQFETYTSFLEAVGTMRFISSLPTRAKRTRGLPGPWGVRL